MSQPMEERGHSGRSKDRRGPVKLESRGRYDVWSRTQSNTFRWNVAEVLCEAAGLGLDRSSDPYHFFTALQSPDWSNGPSSRNLALTQLAALFSKDEDLQSGIDGEAAAFESFQSAEGGCKRINDAYLENRFGMDNPDVGCILFYTQQKIAEILGEAPSWSSLKPTFGPGAAVTCRKKTSARFKLSTPPSISKPSCRVLFQMSAGVSLWTYAHKHKFNVVAGRLEFVPKNYKTKRAIVIGPSLTGMYQKAIGRVMKQKLLKHGIDLYNGQSNQRHRAKVASLTGGVATIDLKAASDSLAYMLILDLIPVDWFELLDALRDDRVVYRNTTYLLEKFSSMGNGYTFELESLVFYALCYGIAKHMNLSVRRDEITVYGDDIIVPTHLAKEVIRLFPEFGFTVNEEKSFIDGPFRESCGGDYCLGVDVRPFFIRGRMTHHGLVSFYNHLQCKPHQDPGRKIRDLILDTLAPKFRIFGPPGYGDGHLVSGAVFESYAVPHGRDSGYAGHTFETYVELPYREKGAMIRDYDWLVPAYVTYMLGGDELKDFEPNVQKVISQLRGYQRLSFIRHFLNERGNPYDAFVLRKPRSMRSKARKIRVYVLGPVE